MSDQLPPRLTESYRGTWRDAADKFDGALTTAIAVIAGYVGQNLHPGRLGPNPTTLEVLALVVLLYALLASFRRNEAVIFVRRHETDRIFLKEEAEAMHTAAERARLTPGAVLPNAATGERATPEDLEAGAVVFRRDAAALGAPIDRANRSATRFYRNRTNALLAGIGLLVASRIWTAYSPVSIPASPPNTPPATSGATPPR